VVGFMCGDFEKKVTTKNAHDDFWFCDFV